VARCQPLVDAAFVHTVTGVDISDLARVDELISITSDIVAEELIGINRCFEPDSVQMRLKLVIAEFVAYSLNSTSGNSIKTEHIGDYRVDYNITATAKFDLATLREMLGPLRKRNYTVYSMNDLVPNYNPVLGGRP
jgi:hypothetical protein